MALDDYGAIMQSAGNVIPDFNRQLLQRAQIGALNAQTQESQAQAQALAAKQQRVQQFQQDIAATDGSPASVSRLIMKYPEFADQLKAGWDVSDKATTQADLTNLGEMYSSALGGDWKTVQSMVHARHDAEQAAGRADPQYSSILDIADKAAAGDPQAQKIAKTMLGSAIAAKTGPDHFGTVYGALNKSETHVLNPGAVLVGDDNQIIAHSPLVQGADGSLYDYNSVMNGTASGGQTAPAGVKRVHGYTPRSSNGGDNPDNVVDNKIATLSKAVGVDPDTPMNAQQFASFVQALPATEGGPGTLSGQQNNPGAIKDGKFAQAQPGYAGSNKGYAVFKTPQAGMAAMQKLLTNGYYNKGQQSIRDIIEGKPVGGQTAQTAQSGGPRVLLPGRDSPDQYHALSPAEVQQRGLDPSQQYQLNTKTGQVTGLGQRDAAGDDILKQYNIGPNETGPSVLQKLPASLASQVKALSEGRLPMPSSFALAKPYWQKMLQLTAQYDPTFDAANAPARKAAITAFTGNGRAAQTVGSVNRVANHLETLWQANKKLAGPDTGFGPLNTVLATAGQAFDPDDAKAYDTAVGFIAGELEKIARNSPGTEAGVDRVVKNLNRHNSSSTREAAIKTAVEIISGAIDPLKEQYNSAFTNGATRPNIPWVTPRAQKIYRQIGGVDMSLTGANANTNSDSDARSGVVHIQSAAQWQALAPGTHYIDPTGVHRIKK
jgi:hypothetical protein